MIHFTKLLAALLLLCAAGCSSGPQTVKSTKQIGTPSSAEVDRALALMKSGDSAGASQAFLALSESYPRSTGPWTNLGILAARQQQYELAAKYFLGALQRSPNNVAALNWMGYITSKNGSYDAALDWYGKALAVRDDYAAAHLNIGILYETAFKQSSQALVHYRRYQALTGGDNILVSAWIHNIESNADYVAVNVSQVN